jgi:hypothetical protein
MSGRLLRSIAATVVLVAVDHLAATCQAGGGHLAGIGGGAGATAGAWLPGGIAALAFKDGVPPPHMDPVAPSPTPLQDCRSDLAAEVQRRQPVTW